MDAIQLKYSNDYLVGQDPKFKDVENQIIEIIKNKSEKAKHYEKRNTIFGIIYWWQGMLLWKT